MRPQLHRGFHAEFERRPEAPEIALEIEDFRDISRLAEQIARTTLVVA
jgi:hypothetical protein